jgi:hypothetical protein
MYMFREVITLDVATGLNFEGHLLGNVFRPMLRAIESYDAARVIESAGNQTRDDIFKIRLFDLISR